MNQLFCPSCCASCFVCTPPVIFMHDSPFALQNLLPLGTTSFKIPVEVDHQICEHSHAEDGWHVFQAHLVLPRLSDSVDIARCQGLAFLCKERFVSATYRSNPYGLMDVRIYLIPYDLPNAHGKLRLRKEGILGPGRRYMRSLLPTVSQSINRWLGEKVTGHEPPTAQDHHTLSDIYSQLASPTAEPIPDYGEISSRLLDFEDNLDGLGMRSSLYGYQRRTVAAMLQKELDLRDVPDPLYITLRTIDTNKPFHIQPGTVEVLQERPMSAACRGGILCEELGTGKTVMMLSLIVATRKQISTPEPSLVDDRPVMTPLAYRTFPSSDFSATRQRACFPKQGDKRVPSLVELLIHRARTAPFCDIPNNTWSKRHHLNSTKEEELSTLPLGTLLQANVPFYHHYLGEPNNRERAQRNKLPPTPRVIYLTSATLVVVPPNLLSQWDREIQKHCALQLRVFILRTKTPMPSVQSLATDYDIILMSYKRLSMESSKQNIMKLHDPQPPCKCPVFENSLLPNCTCRIAGTSPFLQIRWKRLIIDEGHVSSSLSSNLVPFAKLLSVERRWIVTGTPTTNLLGLSLGSKVITDDELVAPSPDNMDATAPIEVSTPPPSSRPSPTSSPSPASSPPPAAKPRPWNKYDREDLNKLGNMITHFIAVPQFSADPKLVATHVVEPLLDPQGPRAGAVQVLNQLMETVMIRHRIEDVEQDVVLPPVKQEAILLDLDPFVIKSFNALQAGLILNAVDSERKDQDYMFHPANAEALQETVRNMSQILFWHVTDDLYNAVQLVKTSEAFIARAIERKASAEDIQAAQEAFKHLRIALEDPVWEQVQCHEDVPYWVYNLREHAFDAWSRLPRTDVNSSSGVPVGLVHADTLLHLYDLALKRPLIKQDDMVEIGKLTLQRDKILRQAFDESQRKKNKGRKKTKSGDDHSSSQMTEKYATKAYSAETLNQMRKDLEASMAKLQQDDEDENESTSKASTSRLQTSPEKRPSALVAQSPFAKVRIGSSASSKLNYIINEVKKYSDTEKFLIFSESALTLAHVAEAMELMHVKSLRFTTQVDAHVREQMVLTFETSDTYRVFLMELKHGARGLNLVSASRVIFCEPVWQADVESQAIKRAHRIGQTRPISVKTLAIRQTAEENMVLRRSALKDSQEKLPKVLEEAGMRHYIANPKFIVDTPTLTTITEFPLIEVAPELLQPRPGAIMLKVPALPKSAHSPKRVRVQFESGEPCNVEGPPEEAPSPKKRKIRFG